MNVKSVKSSKVPFSQTNIFLVIGAIALITYFSYSPAIKNNFINWDDNAYVFDNGNLSKPLTEAVAYFFDPNYFIGNYIPLTMVVYTIEYKFAGLDPHFFHGLNILIHIANSLLVFYFAYLLSKKKLFVATLVSFLFAIHPMHVESVAWVSELKDLLYSFFFLLGLLLYYQYLTLKNTSLQKSNKKTFTQNPSVILTTICFLFILSVLSKPAAITFPFVLLLLDFYTQRKFDKWLWIEKIPFLIISIIFGMIALVAQEADGLLHDTYSLSQRFFFGSHSLLTYLFKLFLPINLSIFYPYPAIAEGTLPSSFYFAPFLVLLLFFGLYKTLKHSRLYVFGFLFFLLNLLPVLQFVSIGEAIMADRYSYISYLGIFYILAMVFDSFVSKKGFAHNKPFAALIVAGLVITLSILTFSRCKIWKNDDTVATDLLNKFPNDRLALNNKGFILYSQNRFKEAIDLFSKAIALKPNYTMAHINLINSYASLNDLNNAKIALNKAIELIPTDFNLLYSKGVFLYNEGNYSEAIKFYNKGLELKKDNINGYIYLAESYFALNDYAKTLKAINEGLGYQPNNYILLNNKGYVLLVMKKYEEASGYFIASLKQKPGYDRATANLANCREAMNKNSQQPGN
ncbi:tetratricopeptide repeat protein [Aurantibacillus circumpalustris]|uniref:tetratricopeptide repeat protein n=1 Tax=Aurantibacillus circumpalustris TaxID=3036359 RepID=UPI00295B8FF5|nr:tetratricopeptide repeat protein [Aurantibacillus circumpalustris]